VASIAVAHEVGFIDFQKLDESECVVSGLPEGEWAVDIGGATVPLLLKGDDHARFGERGEHGSERSVDSGTATVEQDERLAGAADFVIKLEAVDGSVAGFHGELCSVDWRVCGCALARGMFRVVASKSAAAQANFSIA
jgi:hypothetical protein